MTRENKLALVVGFGLILFVGILISDHFSTVQNQRAADLTGGVSDPLMARAAPDEAELINLLPQPEPPPAGQQNPTRANPPMAGATSDQMLAGATNAGSGEVQPIAEQAGPEQRSFANPDAHLAVQMGETNSKSFGATPDPNASDISGLIVTSERSIEEPAMDGFEKVSAPTESETPLRFHDVKGGESLYAICRLHYGDTTLVNALAKFNKIDNPARLGAGHKLVIPPAEAIGGKTREIIVRKSEAKPPRKNAKPQAAVKGVAPKAKTYTVKSGDSLAQIAQRYLGSKSKWQRIYNLNRSIIDDPDNLKVGTVLKMG